MASNNADPMTSESKRFQYLAAKHRNPKVNSLAHNSKTNMIKRGHSTTCNQGTSRAISRALIKMRKSKNFLKRMLCTQRRNWSETCCHNFAKVSDACWDCDASPTVDCFWMQEWWDSGFSCMRMLSSSTSCGSLWSGMTWSVCSRVQSSWTNGSKCSLDDATVCQLRKYAYSSRSNCIRLREKPSFRRLVDDSGRSTGGLDLIDDSQTVSPGPLMVVDVVVMLNDGNRFPPDRNVSTQ